MESWTQPEIKERELNKYNWLVFNKDKLQLGIDTDIGAFTLLDASEGIVIEEGVQIASHCSLYSRTTIDNKRGQITLQKNSCLGTHCVVMPGVTIGENSIIGAMSFVNKDIPKNEVWIGSPARFLKKVEQNHGVKNEAEKKAEPVKQDSISLFKTEWSDKDISQVTSIIKRGTNWAAGPEIEKFEQKLAEFHNKRFAVTFNSGTSALIAMYKAVGIEEKEVIVPSFSFIATANAVILAGGKPIFAESEVETLGLDATDVEKRITPNTKAIVALHYAGGVSRDIENLQEIAKRYDLVLLEDNAHSLGVKKNGKICGTFGTAAALSFCQNKLITTGEGGAVVTNSEELYEKMKLLRSHGRVEKQGSDYFSSTEESEYIDVGYNFRMPTMNAALGISQLNHFDKTMNKRLHNGKYLSEHLGEIQGIIVPKPYLNSDHFYQMYTIILSSQEVRDNLKIYLSEQGVISKVYYSPTHLKTFYRQKFGYSEGQLPHTEDLSKRVLTLPMYPSLTKEDMDLIIKTIRDFMGEDKK